jgi:hypothetical protein
MDIESIKIFFNGKIYSINKEPFETNENTYMRGWFIIKNYNIYNNYDELVSRSFIYINEKNNKMIYL